jgi:hypothetical protein
LSVRRAHALKELAAELFSAEQQERLFAISAARPFDPEKLSEFDDAVAGPSMRRLAAEVREQAVFSSASRSRLSVDDRDVFRPLQYCDMAFQSEDIESRTRYVVQMAGLHLEALVKRLRPPDSRASLGADVHRLREQLGPLASQLSRYVTIYNDAKHQLDHEFGTHMFSVEEAVVAYMVSRVLGLALYPRADLKSDWRFGM